MTFFENCIVYIIETEIWSYLASINTIHIKPLHFGGRELVPLPLYFFLYAR